MLPIAARGIFWIQERLLGRRSFAILQELRRSERWDRQRIKELQFERLRKVGYEGDVVMDGGMNEDTMPKCLGAGANQFSVTSALWGGNDVEERYRKLSELVSR